MHASPTAGNFFLALISTFLVHSPSFSKSSPYFLYILVLANAISHVGPRNKIGHPAHSHKLFKQDPLMAAKHVFCASINIYLEMVGFYVTVNYTNL